jgi:hypothetical protein
VFLNQGTHHIIEIEAILNFVRLPSVNSISAYRVWDDGTADPLIYEGNRPEWVRKPPTLPAKEINLYWSNINALSMIKFLQCFPQLERLYYEDGGTDVGDEHFNPPRIMKAIEHLKPCLQELHIAFDNPEDISWYEEYPIGSLQDFQSLETLELTTTMLIGTYDPNEPFPPN